MATDDVRISAWDLRASAGTTVSLEFTSSQALTSLAVYTGGTTTDVDDLTDATAHTATLSGGNLVATVEVDVPTGSSVPLRLVVDGAVQSVGRLIPSTSGTASPDNTITLTPGSFAFDLTVLGIVVNEGGGEGGTDDQTATEVAFTPTGTIAATDVQAAIAEVSGDVTAEAATRAAADSALSDLIATEQTVRAAADTALDGRLDTVEATLPTKADLVAGVVPDGQLPDDLTRDSELTAALAGKQAASSELTLLAGLSSTTLGRSLLELASSAAGRIALGLVVGTDVQAHSSTLDTLAALTTTTTGRALLTAADAAAARTLLSVYSQTQVDNAIAALSSTYVAQATLDANTLLGATVDNTPVAFPVAASRVVGRKATGDIDDLTTAELAALFGTPDGTKFLADDGTLKTPAGGSGLALPFGGQGGEGYYSGLPGWGPAGTANASGSMNQYDIYTWPIFVPRAITVTGWDIFVNTGHTASTVVRLGIYNASGEDAWAVGGLHTDLGTVASATAGGKSVTGLSVALAAGWYALAIGTNAPALTLYCFRGTATAMRAKNSLGTGANGRNIRLWTDYSSSPDHAATGLPSTLTGSSDTAGTGSFEPVNNPPLLPATIRWSI